MSGKWRVVGDAGGICTLWTRTRKTGGAAAARIKVSGPFFPRGISNKTVHHKPQLSSQIPQMIGYNLTI